MKFKLANMLRLVLGGIAVGLVVCFATGCHTADPPAAVFSQARVAQSNSEVRLNPGDVVQISFPAAANMNTVEKVRIDGKLLLPLVGEVVAAGKTPLELQGDLTKLYATHLQVNEVLVIMASSSASIFVSGAVAHPGRIGMDRPLTLLDAIMEAGGFDPKSANVKKISVIRQTGGKYSKHRVNLKPVLNGENVPPFYLQLFDVIYVPERLF